MEDKNILLSICIPTYNGGEKLRITLNAITYALKNFSDIEIIVSDNCSVDNTSDILSYFNTYKYFRIYKNKQNIGFNKNLFLLVDKYANGKYCWVIGDDDFIDCDSLFHIRNILLTKEIEYLSINYRLRDLPSYNKDLIKKRNEIVFHELSFAKSIDTNAKYSNVLATFMSTSLFLRNKIVSFNKEIFSNNSWDNYYSTFPNSFLMCSVFNNSKSGSISTPLFTALIHEKSWDNKMNILIFNYLPELYKFYITTEINTKELVANKTIIQESIFIRIIFLFKLHMFRDIPLNLFIKSLLWKSTYSLIRKKIKCKHNTN